MYGDVCYVGIDIDPELKYPKVSEFNLFVFVLSIRRSETVKCETLVRDRFSFRKVYRWCQGAARVTFSSVTAFIAAIQGKFIQIPHAESKKRVSHCIQLDEIIRQNDIEKCVQPQYLISQNPKDDTFRWR